MAGTAQITQRFAEGNRDDAEALDCTNMRVIVDALEAIAYRPPDGQERFDLLELVEQLRQTIPLIP